MERFLTMASLTSEFLDIFGGCSSLKYKYLCSARSLAGSRFPGVRPGRLSLFLLLLKG